MSVPPIFSSSCGPFPLSIEHLKAASASTNVLCNTELLSNIYLPENHKPTMSLPFLRPSRLPRPSTIRQFLRATNTRTYSTPSTPSTSETPSSTPSSPPTPSTKPYRVLLSPSNQYPVYQISKRGGNKHETKIKNIQGDIQALRSDLQELLSEEGKEKVDVMLKNVNGQLVVKVCLHSKKEGEKGGRLMSYRDTRELRYQSSLRRRM